MAYSSQFSSPVSWFSWESWKSCSRKARCVCLHLMACGVWPLRVCNGCHSRTYDHTVIMTSAVLQNHGPIMHSLVQLARLPAGQMEHMSQYRLLPVDHLAPRGRTVSTKSMQKEARCSPPPKACPCVRGAPPGVSADIFPIHSDSTVKYDRTLFVTWALTASAASPWVQEKPKLHGHSHGATSILLLLLLLPQEVGVLLDQAAHAPIPLGSDTRVEKDDVQIPLFRLDARVHEVLERLICSAIDGRIRIRPSTRWNEFRSDLMDTWIVYSSWIHGKDSVHTYIMTKYPPVLHAHLRPSTAWAMATFTR